MIFFLPQDLEPDAARALVSHARGHRRLWETSFSGGATSPGGI
jgi:hypothetical protein